MDWLSLLQLAIKWGPVVKGILDVASSNSDIVSKIQADAAPVASLLENIGKSLFPQAAPTLHVVAGAIAAFDPNTTKWLQGELNVFVTPSPNLTVDGIYGPKTKAAVMSFQTTHGLAVDGIAGQVTQSVLSALLAPKPAPAKAP